MPLVLGRVRAVPQADHDTLGMVRSILPGGIELAYDSPAAREQRRQAEREMLEKGEGSDLSKTEPGWRSRPSVRQRER